MSFSRFMSEISDQMRADFPDREIYQLAGEGSNGRVKVRRHHWDPDVTIEVPIVGGTAITTPGATINLDYEDGDKQRPYYRGQILGGVSTLKKKPGPILFGDGQWVTPESDFLNSYGLTVATPQLVLRLDGSSPGTVSTIASFDRFLAGASLPGRWQDFSEHSDQLGLVAFTCSDGSGGTVTVLACYSTIWANLAYSYGNAGIIREYSIAGSSSGISDKTVTFSGGSGGYGYEFRNWMGSRKAADRKHGYLFVDVANEPRGLYVLPLESGIYALRRHDSTLVRTNWVPDILIPAHSGNTSVCGKYLFAGWSGYDKSEAALDLFNASMFGADPTNAYLLDPNLGWSGAVLYPDDSSRAIIRFYTRQDDLSYSYADIDLKGRIPGKTVRRIYGNGVYFPGSRAVVDSDGNPVLIDSSELFQAPRVYGNLISSRWPWLILSERTEAWIAVSLQVDGATSADPGPCYWQLWAINAATRAMTLKNQLATPSIPLTPETYTGLVAAKEAEFTASATASLEPYMEPADYYPTEHFVRRSVEFPTESTEIITDYYLTGYFYDGPDPAEPGDKWTEEDRYVDHPLPADITSVEYLSGGDTGLDAILTGSGSVPGGGKDLNGNHYAVVSEPVHFTSGMELIDRVATDTADPFYPIYTRLAKETIVADVGGVTHIYQLWAQASYSRKTYSRGHQTWLVKTSADGATRTKVDITERFTWDVGGAPIPKASNYPLLASVWAIAPVGDYLFVLRQCYWSVPFAAYSDFDLREPYLEIYRLSDLVRVQKINLHPPTDTGRALFGLYFLAPRMRVGFDASGFVYAEILTEWINLTDYNASNRLELVQHLKTEIKYKTVVEKVDHLWQGTKETGIPLPVEASNLVRNGTKTYWIEASNSVVEYSNP